MKSIKTLMSVLAVILIAVIGFNCAKNSSPTSPGNATHLGKWEWIQTTGGYFGGTFTPETTGHTQAIEFFADSTYLEYRDGLPMAAGSYTMMWDKLFGFPDSGYVVYYDDWCSPKDMVWTIGTLVLLDHCYDGYRHTYVRSR